MVAVPLLTTYLINKTSSFLLYIGKKGKSVYLRQRRLSFCRDSKFQPVILSILCIIYGNTKYCFACFYLFPSSYSCCIADATVGCYPPLFSPISPPTALPSILPMAAPVFMPAMLRVFICVVLHPLHSNVSARVSEHTRTFAMVHLGIIRFV